MKKILHLLALGALLCGPTSVALADNESSASSSSMSASSSSASAVSSASSSAGSIAPAKPLQPCNWFRDNGDRKRCMLQLKLYCQSRFPDKGGNAFGQCIATGVRGESPAQHMKTIKNRGHGTSSVSSSASSLRSQRTHWRKIRVTPPSRRGGRGGRGGGY